MASAEVPGTANVPLDAGTTVPVTAPPDSQAELEAWLTGFRLRAAQAGIGPDVTFPALADVTYLPDVIRRDRNQNEFTKTIWDYLDTAVSEDRVANGRTARAANADTLARIETEYGVPGEVVAAVWGLESAYGTYRGDVPTLSALATLAFDGRRAVFFEGELLAALRIVAAGDADAGTMTGSWAGAMGHTQFMPSSYLRLAVDFNGDGQRDIWGDDPADALASTAAYLRDAGWVAGQPWGAEVVLPPGFDYAQSGVRVVKPVAEWQALGVRLAGGGSVPDHGDASVLLPAGAQGAAFVIFANFRAIEAYNPADAYVIGIGHLADRIAGGPPIAAAWPRGDRALTLPERVELQERLRDAGFDPGALDGRIGPNTIAAVMGWQRAAGLATDGYANPDLLARLR